MGVKCNCTVSRQKEKRIRKQNLQEGGIVMPMFPFFFFFFFFSFTLHKWPWTKGSPKDTLPRRTPGKLWTTTANKFTKQQIYTQTQWITSGPTIIEGHQPSSSRRLTNPKTPLILKSNFKNAPPTHTFLLFLP